MYRETELYKNLNHYDACAIAEGFDGEDHDEDEVLTAWQYIADTGLWRHLQGFYGRTVSDLLDNGMIEFPK